MFKICGGPHHLPYIVVGEVLFALVDVVDEEPGDIGGLARVLISEDHESLLVNLGERYQLRSYVI